MKYSYCTDFNQLRYTDKLFYYHGMINFCLSLLPDSPFPDTIQEKLNTSLAEYVNLNPYC